MIYEDAIKEITNVRTKRFRITTSDGEKRVMRLFVSASNVIIYFIFNLSFIVFTLNLLFPVIRNSLNWQSIPLFLSHPR